MFKYILIAVIIFAAFVTNPSEQNFKSKVENELLNELHSNDGGFIMSKILTSKLVGSMFWSLVKVEYRDFKLCSTFDLHVGNKDVKFLGIFGQIIPISGSSSFDEISEGLVR